MVNYPSIDPLNLTMIQQIEHPPLHLPPLNSDLQRDDKVVPLIPAAKLLSTSQNPIYSPNCK